MARDVYVLTDSDDPSKAIVASFTDDSPLNEPIRLTRSDNSKWRFHWLKRNPLAQVNRPFVYLAERPVTVKVAAGTIDAIPTGGTFTLTGAAGGTTAALAYNASAATIQAAIRAAMTGFTAAVVTLTSTGVFEVDRGATGAVGDITGNSDALTPSGSTVNITNIQDGTASVNEKWQVRLRKALPFLCTSGWTGNTVAGVNVATSQNGSATAGKIFALSWNADAYSGAVWLGVSTTGADTQTVGPIAYNATADEVQSAFETHSGLSAGGLVTIEQAGPGEYSVTFATSFANTPTVVTAINTLLVPVLDQADIAVSTSGADAILAGEQSAEISFEIEISEESGKPRTVARITDATLLADLISNTPGQATGNESWTTQDEVLNFLPSVTAYTGGASNALDAVTTAQKSVPTIWAFRHATDDLRIYILKSGTDAEASPDIIRPDDYAASTNEKVWESML